jgi:hypothetical protein
MAARGKRRSRVSLFETVLILLSLSVIGTGVFLIVRDNSALVRTEVMEQRLKELRQLKTVSQTYRSVIYIEEKSFWLGLKQVLFTLEYEVTAGVDFSRGIELSPLPDNSVSVRMPPAEIFDSDADETTIREMFLREQSFFNPVRMGDYLPQVIEQGEANRRAALESGILARAESNARMAVVRVLRLADFNSVSFGPPLPAKPSGAVSPSTPLPEAADG